MRKATIGIQVTCKMATMDLVGPKGDNMNELKSLLLRCP